MDVSGRLGRLVERLATEDAPWLLVSNRANILYLSGFTGSAGHLLVGEHAVLVTDGRYTEQAPAQIDAVGADVEVVISGQLTSVLNDRLGSNTTLGFEASTVTWADYQRMAAALKCDLVPLDGVVEALRERKDPGEVDRIGHAAAIADAALAEVRPLLLESVTEAHFGLELDTAMRRAGAEERSFETIVASGPNAALPHARPGDRAIEPGDLVVIDFGAMIDGYHSDMTRTFSVGEPDDFAAELLAVVTEAQRLGCELVAPGVEAKAIDHACRSSITVAGFGEYFMHGTGHGVGLDIHEAPAVSSRSQTVLESGHIITVEPGVYVPGRGGVRVEDTVAVTDDGYSALTRYPKDLAVVVEQ